MSHSSKQSLQRTLLLSKYKSGGFLFALIVGIGVIFLFGGTVFAALHNQIPPTPNVKQSQGYWKQPETAFYHHQTVVTDKRIFRLNDTIIMPNGVALQVTQVERNWQPALSMTGYGPTKVGDDPTGREIILVWFKVTDTGKSPIPYNDSMFTLTRAGKPEQRVAYLSSLSPSSYGSQGRVPWLLPGQSMTTFVPFLVTPGETSLVSFQYYPPIFAKQGSKLPWTLARLSISLQNFQRGASLISSQKFTFQGNTQVSVGS